MKYLPTCPNCHIYPRQKSTDPKSVCFRCEEKARRLKQELEAEARTAPRQTDEPDQADDQAEQFSIVGRIESPNAGHWSVWRDPNGQLIREWQAIPCCSRCMTTIDVKYVDVVSNTGICQKCIRKRHQSARWGMSGLAGSTDANAIR